jgi:hypothetical protein
MKILHVPATRDTHFGAVEDGAAAPHSFAVVQKSPVLVGRDDNAPHSTRSGDLLSVFHGELAYCKWVQHLQLNTL